jgi:glycosyltransferase involved in cell wall biosynthesis
MTKIKLLWVVFDFVQAGGQRYVYEICKALNKDKYQIDFLRINEFAADKNWDNEHYYQSTLNLGSKIYLLGEFKSKLIADNSLIQRFKNKLSASKLPQKEIENNPLEIFLSGYNYINFAGVSTYESICIKRKLKIDKSIIHILTAKFQGIDIYKNYNKDLSYYFISAFDDFILKSELEEFKNYKHSYFPLSMQMDLFEIKKRNNKTSKLTIGIFTRLSPMKPLDPYFYALKLLIDNGVNVELSVYGAGDPVKLGLIRQLEYLYIKDYVVFCGHTESIKETLINEDFNLVWFQSANQQLAGYAAIEIAMAAVPQILWDFSYVGGEVDVQHYFPSFTNLSQFVELSKQLLNSTEQATQLGIKQRQFVVNKHGIENNINTLEKIFDDGY